MEERAVSYALLAATAAPIVRASCPNDCSAKGKCLAMSVCVCDGGWTGSDCSAFILAATVLGNTSELGSQALLVFSVAGDVSPASEVRCALQSSRASEARVEAELVLEPGQLNQTVRLSGVPDILDDGAQQFAISVGPCISDDERFNFDWVRARVAFGWNEDHSFPLVESIEPTQSALLGESITIRGRHLNRETSVCVNGTVVSSPPDYRVSLTIVTPSGDVTAFEVMLRSPAAVQWFQNVSGAEYRPYAPRPCPQLAARRRPSAVVTSIADPPAAGSTGATNEAAAAAARLGVDIKSMRCGVLDTTDGPTVNASAFSNDTANGSLHIPGVLAVAGLEFIFTAVSRIPTEPLLNQARTQQSSVLPARKELIAGGCRCKSLR